MELMLAVGTVELALLLEKVQFWMVYLNVSCITEPLLLPYMVMERPPPDTLEGRSVKTDCALLFSKVLAETVTTRQLYMLTGPWVKSLSEQVREKKERN